MRRTLLFAIVLVGAMLGIASAVRLAPPPEFDLHADKSDWQVGERMAAHIRIRNTALESHVRAYLFLEHQGQFFYWPTMETLPQGVDLNLSVGYDSGLQEFFAQTITENPVRPITFSWGVGYHYRDVPPEDGAVADVLTQRIVPRFTPTPDAGHGPTPTPTPTCRPDGNYWTVIESYPRPSVANALFKGRNLDQGSAPRASPDYTFPRQDGINVLSAIGNDSLPIQDVRFHLSAYSTHGSELVRTGYSYQVSASFDFWPWVGTALAEDINGSFLLSSNTRGVSPEGEAFGGGSIWHFSGGVPYLLAMITEQYYPGAAVAPKTQQADMASHPMGGFVTVGTFSEAGPSFTLAGCDDIYVTRWRGCGNSGSCDEKEWVTPIGSTGCEGVNAVAVAPDGTIYVAGWTTGSFGPVPNQGGKDMLLAAVAPDGVLLWVHHRGDGADDVLLDVAVDDTGNLYVCGSTQSGFATVDNAFADAYISRRSSGGGLIWEDLVGGADNEEARALDLDSDGKLHVACSISRTGQGLPTTSGLGLNLRYAPDGLLERTDYYGPTTGQFTVNAILALDDSVVTAGSTTQGFDDVFKADGVEKAFVTGRCR